jgi:hypothetical protein
MQNPAMQPFGLDEWYLLMLQQSPDFSKLTIEAKVLLDQREAKGRYSSLQPRQTKQGQMLYDAVLRSSGLTNRSQKIPGPWFRASDQYDPRLHHSCLQIRYPFKESRRDVAGRCNATFRFSNVREVQTCSSRRTRKPNVVRAAKSTPPKLR